MCVSLYRAELRGTKIGMNEPDPAVLGHPTRVMLYQNQVRNIHAGPNAMLLHIDSARPMGRENFIPATRFRHALDDMVEAIQPKTRGGSMTLGAKGLSV